MPGCQWCQSGPIRFAQGDLAGALKSCLRPMRTRRDLFVLSLAAIDSTGTPNLTLSITLLAVLDPAPTHWWQMRLMFSRRRIFIKPK